MHTKTINIASLYDWVKTNTQFSAYHVTSSQTCHLRCIKLHKTHYAMRQVFKDYATLRL